MNEKSPDFSQKVWYLTFGKISLVEKCGGNKWLLFSCLVSDHVKTFHDSDEFGEEEQGGGAWAPREEKVRDSVQFWKGNRREEDHSPDVTLMPTPSILLWTHSGQSVPDRFCFSRAYVTQNITLR